MNKGNILILAFCLTALLVINGCAAAGGGGGGAAHAHIKHVTEGWKDTPNGMGLGPTMEEEAKIALKHAQLALKKPSDLAWVKTHIRHIRHAIDTTTESSGPGMGYGVIKAARGVAKHINFAAGSSDASANVKLHATHVATSAKNVVRWSNRVILLSEVSASSSLSLMTSGFSRNSTFLPSALNSACLGQPARIKPARASKITGSAMRSVVFNLGPPLRFQIEIRRFSNYQSVLALFFFAQ